MSEFKKFKKADLAKVVRKFGNVRSKDTKLSLLERLDAYSKHDPEAYRQLVEEFESGVNDDDEEEETATLVEVDVTEEEEDDDDGADEEETDVADEEEVDDDAEEDKDYNAPPPIDFKEYVVDPAIAFFENSYEKLLEFTDSVGLTSAEFNDDVRFHLSNTINLTYLELLAEVSYFLYFYVPIVEVRKNKFLPQFLKDQMLYLDSNILTPDLSYLFNCTVFSVLVQWILYAVLVPGVISYYINFTRKVVVIESDQDDEDDEELSYVVRLHHYDPLIFSLAKIVIFYFIIKNGAFTTIDSAEGILHVLKEYFLVKLGVYHDFAVGLGNFPLVIGAANVVIGLYSQFEDF